MRGLEITPVINPYSTGINFTIAPGALIHDLTYFELPTSNFIEMDDAINFPNYYIVIYTSWKYIQTVYDNPLKIEATFYNPETKRAITGWDTHKNRVVLGIYSYEVINNQVTFIQNEDIDLFFEDSNIVQNGTFDLKSFKFWTAINSTLKIREDGGVSDTPFLRVTPIAESYQGIAQTLQTKTGYNYEVSFYVRSDDLLPFKALVLDGSSMYNMDAPEIANYSLVTPRGWTNYTFRFQAISNNTTVFFLKTSDDLESTFDIDSIFCLEYLETKKQTDINKIKVIDGGQLGGATQNNDSGSIVAQSFNVDVVPNQRTYSLKDFKKSNGGQSELVFYDSDKLAESDYNLNSETGEISLNFTPTDDSTEMNVVSLSSDTAQLPVTSWEIQLERGVNTYSPENKPLIDPSLGTYFVFYASDLLNNLDYAIDYTKNRIILSNDLAQYYGKMYIYFVNNKSESITKSWRIKVVPFEQNYSLPDSPNSSTGLYMVFYGPNKLRESDYTISNGVLSLSLSPVELGVEISVYFIGKGK